MTIRRPGFFVRRRGRRQDGRRQVGETLAHARAGLDDQMAGLLDGRRHRLRHRKLLAAILVMLQPGGNPAPRPQDVGGRVHGV